MKAKEQHDIWNYLLNPITLQVKEGRDPYEYKKRCDRKKRKNVWTTEK